VFSRSWLAWCHAARGEFAAGIACGEEAVQLAEAVDHSYSLIVASVGLGTVHLVKGNLEKAVAALERGLVIDQMAAIPLLFPFVASPLGYAYALLGRTGEALRLLEQAVERATFMKLMANHSLRAVWLAEAHWRAGGPAHAVEPAGRALEAARQHRERGHEGWALRLLGEIAPQRDALEVSKAEEYYRQAMAVADELGMRPLAAHCHLGLGRLYRRTGKGEEAQAHLTTAKTMLREMDMRFWLEKSDAELEFVHRG
jgi:tetratricopeptide (TPR) repeat protein